MQESLTLNVVPISGFPDTVNVYYGTVRGAEKRPAERVYHVRVNDIEAHWITFSKRQSFNAQKSIRLDDHPWIALHLAQEALFETARNHELPQFRRARKAFFENTLEIIIEQRREGARVMSVRPLRSAVVKGIGLSFLERFLIREGLPYTRQLQILTGSLDASGRPNAQYHVEAWQRLQAFLKGAGAALKELRHEATGAVLQVGDAFARVEGDLLHSRRYNSPLDWTESAAQANPSFMAFATMAPMPLRAHLRNTFRTSGTKKTTSPLLEFCIRLYMMADPLPRLKDSESFFDIDFP